MANPCRNPNGTCSERGRKSIGTQRETVGNCSELSTRRTIILHSTPNTTGELVPVAPTALVVPQQAESDQHLIDLWLHGRSRHTQRAYRADTERFLEAVGKPLHRITLGDLQTFAGQLVESGLEPSSVHRSMSAVKSLFAFGIALATCRSTWPDRCDCPPFVMGWPTES